MSIFIIIISILFILLECYLLFYLGKKIKRHHKLTLKDTAIYPIIIILCATILMIGKFVYLDFKPLDGISSSLKEAVSVVAMALNTDFVKALKDSSIVASKFLMISYIGIYIISGVALLSISISLLFVVVTNTLRKIFIKFNRVKELNYIFGFNDDCKEYIKNYSNSLKNNKDLDYRTIVILDNSILDKHENEKFFLNKYKTPFVEMPYGLKMDIHNTFNKLGKKNKKIRLISFIDDDYKNFNFVNEAIDYLKNNDKDIEFIVVANIEQETFLNNMIFTNEADRENHNSDIFDLSKGKIRIINKYDLISKEFIKNHNFAKYLPKELINDDLTINDSDINLYMFGFGKVNQHLLRDILINNQFVKKELDNNKYKLKPLRINVEIFETNKKIECFELNNGLLKYDKQSYEEQKNNYLDLPDDYKSYIDIKANVSVYEKDFIKNLFNEIDEKCKNKNQINYFIISVGTDFENSDIAVKLKNNLNHIHNDKHKIYNNYFVRLKNINYDVKNEINSFGSNYDVLNYENIVGIHTDKLAKLFNEQYNKYAGFEADKWETLTPIKRRSNEYAAYGLYFKLSLLTKLIKEDIEINLDLLKDIINKYDRKELNIIPNYDQLVDLKDINELSFYDSLINLNAKFDIRDVFSFIEHERWNAFEFSQGALPMNKENAVKLSKDANKFKNKTNDEMYHLCLVSNYGLKEYYYFVSNTIIENNLNKGSADVVAYDYISMDMISKDLSNNNLHMIDIYNELIKYLNNDN